MVTARMWYALLVAAMLHVGVAQSAVTQACLAKDAEWDAAMHTARMRELGITCATVYYSLMSKDNRKHPYEWVRKHYLDAGYRVVLVLKLDAGNSTTESRSVGNLQAVVGGYYDTALDELIARIKRDGRPIVVRPFHEIDGDWHPWGMYTSGNSPQLAVAAVEHIAARFRDANAPVMIEINFNRRDGKGKVLGDAEYYIPRFNEFVDAYSISTYNRCGTAKRYTTEQSFATEFKPAYDRLLGLTTKPINVAETSTSGLCGARLPWFRELFRTIDSSFTQVESVTFVFGTVPVGAVSNDRPIQWGFSSTAERAQFKAFLQQSWPQLPLVPSKGRETRPSLDFRAPWSAFAQLTYPFEETSNPALNPVTGTEFGKQELVLRSQFKQRLLFDAGNDFEVGPGVYVGLVESTNDDQWWNNHGTLGATLGLYREVERSGAVDWGGWSVELYVERRQFTTDAPSRYRGDGETQAGIRAGLNIGGDWTRH